MSFSMVKAGDWIKIKSVEKDAGIDGFVLSVSSDKEVSVGYYQNSTKTIKEDVVWNGSHWKFKYDCQTGARISGRETAIVKKGPRP